ncbi:MAG: hypothetical protein FJ014_17870, partial [Chloroflexi bacterium]|nr:hypothetical protein [Chloroflexota bacterium]
SDPACLVPLVEEPQGEALAFAADGLGYYTISEGAFQPIYFYEDLSTWVVSCLGDSITEGIPYSGTENTYPARLQVMLDAAYGSGSFEVINHGVGGYRADQVLADLQNLNWMAQDNPDFVLLLVGGNDLAQLQSIESTVAEVQAIVDVVTAHINPDDSHPQIIVSAIPPNLISELATWWVSVYNDSLESNLTGMDLWFTSNWDDFYDPATGQADASLMADLVHPNVEGYVVMAENWFEVLDSLLPTPTPTATSTPTGTPTATPSPTNTPTPTATPTSTPTPTTTSNSWPPPVPAELILTVRETAGIARSGEIVRSGVPLPHSLDVRDTNTLTLVDAGGTPVPAEFQVLARWHAGREDTNVPIQWLLVTFPASVAANGSTTYRLVTDGSAGPNPPPAVAVSLAQDGDQITVDTGAAIFRLGGDPGALFDEIRLADGTRLVSGGALVARVVDAQTSEVLETSEVFTRRLAIEHAGPLTAIVVVEGAYDMAPVGGGGLSSFRRYVFTAGSPTAIVRQAVNWEGDRCPANGWDLTCDADSDGDLDVNGLRIERVRDTLTLDLTWPLTMMAVGDFQTPAVQGSAIAGQSAWVCQQLRTTRTDPLAFDVHVPGTSGASGTKADGAMLAVSDTSGAVAVALNHMHRYEPQALRLLDDGRLAVDMADDQVWLGQRQGLFATLAVSALPAPLPPIPPTLGGARGAGERGARSELDRLLWSPLNHPLRAWPEPAWFAASDAVDEFPVGLLPADLADYDTLVATTLANTLQKVDEKGLAGLMTFGVYPRYWGTPLYGDELDCGGNDPTSGETWDNTYWCATWTDYHNTVATAPIWAMRSGQVEWLDEIAFPGALRTLHTQIMQCATGDDWFYCGQAPAGYGGYRADFNGSHAYFDNLFLYYWLTGDHTVVEMLERGASSMRDYLCSRRPGAPCLPDDPPTDFWAQLTGRVASQWFAVFRFVGLASDDPSYLEDHQSGLARAVTQHYVEAQQNSTGYGFWLYGGDPVDGPGTDTTDQLWMVSLYDMNNLYRLQRDTNDATIGNPAIPPDQVLAAWARTLVDFGSTVSGDGTANGLWPSALYFTWEGDRIGGALIEVTANTEGGDPYLWNTNKANLTALLLRAGQQTGDTALTQMGADLTYLALDAALDDGSPLGKVQGLYLSRLHAAVARLAAATCDLPGDLNCDCVVDIADIMLVAACWRSNDPACAPYDLDDDSDIDIVDIMLVAVHWGESCDQ